MSREKVVLRIRRIDVDQDDDAYVVLEITSTSARHASDVRLVGSDGESVFVGQVKSADVANLSSGTSHCSESEWEAVLGNIFRQKPPHTTGTTIVEGVEVVANVSGQQLVVTIRKNIQGIIQRLGAITLVQNENEVVDFIGWAATAATATQSAIDQMAEIQARVEEQQNMIRKLQRQVDELEVSKKSQEDDLLRKFTELLNSKKRKIRDQQRLLAGAKIDKKTASEAVGNAASRKRRLAVESPGEDEESDGFESVGGAKGEKHVNKDNADLEMEDARTPSVSEDGTMTDDEDGGAEVQKPAVAMPRRDTGQSGDSDDENDAAAAGIPRRELPFARGAADRRKQTSNATEAEGKPVTRSQTAGPTGLRAADEEDETDDEL